MNQDPFKEYIRESEPNKREKGYAWQTAIGLQAVDGLKTSKYLINTAIRNIEGDISIDEANSLLNSYYEKKPKQDPGDRTEEADKVSVVVGNLRQDRADRFFYLQQSGNDLAQLLQYVQRRLYFSPSLCYNYGNTGQFSVRCYSGCRDGSSAVDLSQTCEDHRALSRSTEQPSEICSGTFAYCMAWCQRTDDYCLRYVGCYLWFDFESVYRFWRS